MRIVIAGCGRVGSDLALSLSADRHDISVVDRNEDAFRALGSTFDGATFVGSAYDIEALREAGIEYAEGFVAVTSSDNANLMSVQLAKQVFAVPTTIARLDDPARADSYQALGVVYVAASKLVSNVIHEQLLDVEFLYHTTFSGGDIEVVEMRLGPQADGVAVAEFEIDDNVRVAAVVRQHRTTVPRDDFLLQEGDLVVAATRHGSRDKVRRYLAERSEP